jgi:hypothetical protein
MLEFDGRSFDNEMGGCSLKKDLDVHFIPTFTPRATHKLTNNTPNLSGIHLQPCLRSRTIFIIAIRQNFWGG